MNKRLMILSAAFAIFLSETSLGDGDHQIFEIENFDLESGEILPIARLSYVTHGQLNENKDNLCQFRAVSEITLEFSSKELLTILINSDTESCNIKN